MLELARMATLALGAALGLMAVSYGLAYRRRFAAVPEGTGRGAKWPGLSLATALLECFSFRRDGFRRAIFRFVTRALLRNDAQRFCLAASLSLGWLLAFQSAASALGVRPRPGAPPDVALLAAPLITAYLAIAGIRLAFEVPAALPANWVFLSVLNYRDRETLCAVRRVMLAAVALFVLLPYFAYFWWSSGLVTAGLETAYTLALSEGAVELAIFGYRKVPFAYPTPGFRDTLPLRCLTLLIGFLAFTQAGAAVERWMLLKPPRFVAIPPAMAAAYWWNRGRLNRARAAGELEEGLTFDSEPSPGIERLRLLDHE
jgi:hypothetical protein